MDKDLRKLLNASKRYKDYKFTDEQMSKIVGDPEAGKKVEIHWCGKYLKDVVDYGYCFTLPGMDDDFWMLDFLIHVPQPENPSGNENEEQQFVHIGTLVTSKIVEQIVFNSK